MIIGFGSIWGLFAFGGMLFSSFTIGTNDSAPEVLTILLNGLTILPSCILAIWFMRYAPLWLMLLSPITALGLVCQVIHSRSPAGDYWTSGWHRRGTDSGRHPRSDRATSIPTPRRGSRIAPMQSRIFCGPPGEWSAVGKLSITGFRGTPFLTVGKPRVRNAD